MSSGYCLRIIRAENLLWHHFFHNRVPDPYVLFKLGNITRMTRTVRQTLAPVWNESIVFPSSDTFTTMVIEVKHDSWSSDPCVGRTEINFKDFLAKCASEPGDAILDLSLPYNGAFVLTGRIILRLDVISIRTGAEISIATAQEDIRHGKMRRYAGVSDVTESISNRVTELSDQGELYRAVGQLIARLDAFQQIMNTLSEIHPFLTIAWKLASGLYSAVQNVFRTDEKVVHLVRSMEEAFSFVRDVQMLPKPVTSIQSAIVGLLKQTVECCIFVSTYVKRGFLKRMLDITSSQKIDEFEQALASFKQQIESGVVLQTALVSTRAPQKINDLLLRQRLNPSLSNAFHRPCCLPNTRVEIRREIIDWAFSESKQNIFWLHGVAGSGKSTISTTIVQHFRDMSRLGAFLFFERGKSDPASVIGTLAYKLALFDSSIGDEVLSQTDNDGDISSTLPIDQFTKLLLRPLSQASTDGPILIVLDALDECGTPETRHPLMELFQEQFACLPKKFRVLITSRQEDDIDDVLSSQPEIVRAVGLDYTSAESQQDVLAYLRKEMYCAVKMKVPRDWPWEENLTSLGRAAGGLFIWASTAVKLVSSSDNPFRVLRTLVSDSCTIAHFGLDVLYATVLRNCGISWADDDSRSRFAGVLYLLLFGKVPLSNQTIDGVLGFPPEESSHLVLSRLRCLLSYSPGEPVRLLHASFGDYLTSLEHSNEPWFIDSLVANRLILDRCFTVMESMLHFNMCDLETSFVSNSNVPGLKGRVEAHIPPHLEYACIHWAHHLHDIPYHPDVVTALDNFGHRRLLFWFEVLSLTGMFGRVANSALREAFEWTEANNTDLSAFLRDAADLATIFAVPITESTPHIYVTMIPLSKDESIVSAHYSRQMSSLVQVQRLGSKRPLKYMRVLEGHSGSVHCVAVSPDGSLVVSGSWDRTIRVWGFHGGEEKRIFQNGGSVESVKFLPDGRHVVSISEGSNGKEYTLTVWDIHTGDVVHSRHHLGKPVLSSCGTRAASVDGSDQVVVWNVSDGMELLRLTEDTGVVKCVALSHGGRLLASHHRDGTVRIWNAENGKLEFGPYDMEQHSHLSSFSPDGKYFMYMNYTGTTVLKLDDGGTVLDSTSDNKNGCFFCAAYSPCGTRIAVGFEYGDVLLLDAKTGEAVSGPFKGHTDNVDSVTFTPDGRHIICGSDDKTVRIWDTTVNSETLEEQYIDRVIISDDGSRVASALLGKIVVWDADSGDVIAGPLDSDYYVSDMAFSPDNARLVSASDETITVWDVETSQQLFDLIECPGRVSCIAISPNGTSIASGDDGGEIMIWTLATGQPIAGPLLTSSVNSLEFSPDGRRLALGTRNGKVLIWSTETWQVIFELSTGCDGDVCPIRFSPDSTQLASIVNDRVIAWDMERRRVLFGPWKSCGRYSDLVFTWSGLYVISSGDGSGILVKKADAGGLHTIYELQDFGCVNRADAACSKDGSRVVSWVRYDDLDVCIRVWDVSEILRSHEERRPDASSKRTLRNDGWVVGGRDQQDLLIWIPYDLRKTLHRPRVTLLNTGSKFSTELDFAGAALGDQWMKCFTTV